MSVNGATWEVWSVRYRPKIKPWPHQARALKRLWKMGSAILWFKVRTGKTKIVVDYAAARYLAGQARRVVVVCPPAVVGVWENEIRNNVPEGIPYHIRSRNDWKKLSEVLSAIDELNQAEGLCFLIVTYDTITQYNKAIGQQFQPDILVFDESHYIKNYKAQRTKRALHLSRHAVYVLCLSGTPAPNGHIDLYWQAKVVNPLVLPPTIGEFRERYCIMDHWGNVVGYKNEDELAQRLSQIVLRAETPLKLPPTVDHTIPVVLDPEARQVYDKLRLDLTITLHEGKSITTNNALTLLLRLSQITGGYLDGAPLGEQAKLKTLLELLEYEEDKVVIWCRFLAEVKGILQGLQKLGKTCTYITGSVTGRERAARIRRFQEESSPQILVCQSQALNVGVDLTAASTSIFYSLDWNSETYEQARGRIHGPRQTETCHYLHLICRNTVDEVIYSAVREKMSRQQMLAEVVRRLSDGG